MSSTERDRKWDAIKAAYATTSDDDEKQAEEEEDLGDHDTADDDEKDSDDNEEFIVPDDVVVTSNNKVKPYPIKFDMEKFRRHLIGKQDRPWSNFAPRP